MHRWRRGHTTPAETHAPHAVQGTSRPVENLPPLQPQRHGWRKRHGADKPGVLGACHPMFMRCVLVLCTQHPCTMFVQRFIKEVKIAEKDQASATHIDLIFSYATSYDKLEVDSVFKRCVITLQACASPGVLTHLVPPQRTEPTSMDLLPHSNRRQEVLAPSAGGGRRLALIQPPPWLQHRRRQRVQLRDESR